MMTARFEKKDFKRMFILADLLVLGIFALSLTMLVRDAYIAGFWDQRDPTQHTLQYWYMMRDIVFLVASVCWIFVRYFKDKIVAMQNPWAS